MQAVTRSQLADACGISRRTLQRWLMRYPHADQITPYALIPPKQAREICEFFDIEVEQGRQR